jgi:hypothetical protein
MTEDLKRMILKAAEVLQSYGASEVFFFGAAAKAKLVDETVLDLAVSGLPPDVFFPAMGAVLSVVKRPCNLVDLDEDDSYVEHLKAHRKLQPDLAARVDNELQRLHSMLDTYRPLLDRVHISDPSETELIALAGVVLLLYSGIDATFRYIAAEYDSGFTKGTAFDADVLERMVMPAPGRSSVISRMLMEQLYPYMSFRQSFTGTSACRLNWRKMKHLVGEVDEILLLVEAELSRFIAEEVTPVVENEAPRLPN